MRRPRSMSARRTATKRSSYRSSSGRPKARRRLSFSSRSAVQRKKVAKPRMVLYKNLLKQKCLTRMRYVDTKSLAPGTGAHAHRFAILNLYKPDYDGVGHQPSYHDQWATLYHNYRVLKCTWSVTFRLQRAVTFNIGGTAGNPYTDSTAYDDAQNGIIGWELRRGSNTARERFESADKNFLRETGKNFNTVAWKYLGAHGTKTLRGSTTAAAILNDKDHSLETTPFNNAPPHEAELHVCAMSKEGNPFGPVQFDIVLDFLVELTDPKPVDES